MTHHRADGALTLHGAIPALTLRVAQTMMELNGHKTNKQKLMKLTTRAKRVNLQTASWKTDPGDLSSSPQSYTPQMLVPRRKDEGIEIAEAMAEAVAGEDEGVDVGRVIQLEQTQHPQHLNTALRIHTAPGIPPPPPQSYTLSMLAPRRKDEETAAAAAEDEDEDEPAARIHPLE